MKSKTDVVCIIPARSGSKRIKNKNIINFFGKPMIGYSIIAAKKTGIFKKILISTDSKKIAKISKKYGGQCPNLRKKNLADDHTTTSEVLFNEIQNFNTTKNTYHCCIYPCNPLVDFKILKKAFFYFKKNNFDSLFAVSKYSHSILRSFKIKKKNINYKFPKNINTRSQDLESFVHDAGSFYFFKTKEFLIQKKLFMKNTGFYIIPKYSHIDLDTKEDFDFLKKIYALKYL
jgi:pseudaminic acid cytidylyltransferase